jgi:hypothetical protein
MDRRLFLKASGSAVALAAMPFPFINLNTQSWTSPEWLPSESIRFCSSLLFQFNRKITKPFPAKNPFTHPSFDYQSTNYVRSITVFYAAPNVTAKDIVNEAKAKWNDDEAILTTFGSEGHFIDEDRHSFRAHWKVKDLKAHLVRMKEEEDRQSMDDYKVVGGITPKGLNYFRKHRIWYDEKYRHYHVMPTGGSIVSEAYKKSPRYSLETFADAEMIGGRDKAIKDIKEKKPYTLSDSRSLVDFIKKGKA